MSSAGFLLCAGTLFQRTGAAISGASEKAGLKLSMPSGNPYPLFRVISALFFIQRAAWMFPGDKCLIFS